MKLHSTFSPVTETCPGCHQQPHHAILFIKQPGTSVWSHYAISLSTQNLASLEGQTFNFWFGSVGTAHLFPCQHQIINFFSVYGSELLPSCVFF